MEWVLVIWLVVLRQPDDVHGHTTFSFVGEQIRD